MRENVYSVCWRCGGFGLMVDVLKEDYVLVFTCWLVFGVWQVMDVLFLFDAEIEVNITCL